MWFDIWHKIIDHAREKTDTLGLFQMKDHLVELAAEFLVQSRLEGRATSTPPDELVPQTELDGYAVQAVVHQILQKADARQPAPRPNSKSESWRCTECDCYFQSECDSTQQSSRVL